jgi:hypothetical protein
MTPKYLKTKNGKKHEILGIGGEGEVFIFLTKSRSIRFALLDSKNGATAGNKKYKLLFK